MTLGGEKMSSALVMCLKMFLKLSGQTLYFANGIYC